MIKFMIFLLVLAFAGLFFLKGPNGEQILSVTDFAPSVPEINTPNSPAIPTGPTKVYKWQDENGVWQFSNQAVDAENGEVIELDGKINIVPAIVTLDEPDIQDQPAASQLHIPAGLTTVPSDQINQMIDTVNNLQSTVDDRKEMLDKASGN